jgi:ribonuclease HI
MLMIYADGSARPNPGLASYGLWIDVDGHHVTDLTVPIGRTTCNVAEWRALVAALLFAHGAGVETVRIQTDSRLVVEQVMGRWKVKAPHLRTFCQEAQALMREFKSCRVEWVPRERNEADAVSRSERL